MKTITTLLLALSFMISFGNESATFTKLCELNRCWQAQPDVDRQSLPASIALSEREWIRYHLSMVEQTLRARSTTHLSASQKQNRLQSLDDLHRYLLAGNFPVNDLYATRTPIFIDRYDNFCAVGYLLKASGYEHVSRMISEQTNLAYVHEMKYPELPAWAKEYGFSVEELAWIQPGYWYGPEGVMEVTLPNGFDAGPKCMTYDSVKRNLYVGGSFGAMNLNQQARGYAVYSVDSASWSTDEKIYDAFIQDMTMFQGKPTILGYLATYKNSESSAVKYYDSDSSKWFSLGTLQLRYLDDPNHLFVWNDELYAYGTFIMNYSGSVANILKWNGFSWQPPAFYIHGEIRTLEDYNGKLIIGGSFDTLNSKNVLAYNGTILEPVGSGLPNEVLKLKTFKGKLYAGCTVNTVNDTSAVMFWDNNEWKRTGFLNTSPGKMRNSGISVMEVAGDSLILGGNFFMAEFGGWDVYYGENLGVIWNDSIAGQHRLVFRGLTSIDYSVNDVALINNKLYAVGDFTRGYNVNQYSVLNGIGYCDFKKEFTRIDDISSSENFGVQIYPNPVGSNSTLHIRSDRDLTQVSLLDISGRVISETKCNAASVQLSLKDVSKGLYLLQINSGEDKGLRKVVVVE